MVNDLPIHYVRINVSACRYPTTYLPDMYENIIIPTGMKNRKNARTRRNIPSQADVGPHSVRSVASPSLESLPIGNENCVAPSVWGMTTLS